MQTFLCGDWTLTPRYLFASTAQDLDRLRLGKQRVEAYQILLTNLLGRKAWRNHPACKMWAGYEYALAEYGSVMCNAWILRGYKDSLLPKFKEIAEWLPEETVEYPDWLLNPNTIERVVLSHRRKLIEKDPSWYSLKRSWFWPHREWPTEYFWPGQEKDRKSKYWY